ncbi:MAG: class I SAM-dependent methyltransferase [Alphaproteobacteria bacterium]|nr:class I SAM-dependent methyltransferase [Alphaproteobacteria bacterium]
MGIVPSSYIEKQWRNAIEAMEYGTLEFIAPGGDEIVAKGPKEGPTARFKLNNWDVLRQVMARGDVGLGEEYIAGNWETDDIETLVSLFLLNMDHLDAFANGNALNRFGMVLHNTLLRRNSLKGSKRNIQDHYDVGNEFYSLWLDRSMTYSSALYGAGEHQLEEAQQRKYGRILERIEKSGASILEIGCGWGGFAERAAAENHHVTGLTISPAQHSFATKRLGDAAEIRLEDYRQAKGAYDAIVSIEMFEAVGEHYWPQYFRTIAERLKRGGRAVVQTITIQDDLFASYRKRSDFVRRYVFPGGMLPSLRRFREEAERAGLMVADAFSFGKDYAKTLREWSKRMHERKNEIFALGHDQKFLRNWEFYLGICAATFAIERTDVAQVELVHA